MDKLSAFIMVKGKYQYRGIFGIDKKQFEKLFDHFENLHKEEILNLYENRKEIYSRSDNGLTARLKYIEEEKLRQYLHVTIYYLRHYPTLEVLGWAIGKTKQEAFEIVYKWFALLIKSLDKCKVLPARNLKHMAQVAEDLLGQGVIDNEELDLIIDVTERNINGPKKNQKAYYSEKKISCSKEYNH
jgi:hypothetical protein